MGAQRLKIENLFVSLQLEVFILNQEKMSAEDKKIVKSLQKELVNLMLKKAKVSKQTLYDAAISGFVNDNMDLLSSDELKKYQQILMV